MVVCSLGSRGLGAGRETCADQENFVRGSPTLTGFFIVFFIGFFIIFFIVEGSGIEIAL